jgi:hypothetical protein
MLGGIASSFFHNIQLIRLCAWIIDWQSVVCGCGIIKIHMQMHGEWCKISLPKFFESENLDDAASAIKRLYKKGFPTTTQRCRFCSWTTRWSFLNFLLLSVVVCCCQVGFLSIFWEFLFFTKEIYPLGFSTVSVPALLCTA